MRYYILYAKLKARLIIDIILVDICFILTYFYNKNNLYFTMSSLKFPIYLTEIKLGVKK